MLGRACTLSSISTQYTTILSDGRSLFTSNTLPDHNGCRCVDDAPTDASPTQPFMSRFTTLCHSNRLLVSTNTIRLATGRSSLDPDLPSLPRTGSLALDPRSSSFQIWQVPLRRTWLTRTQWLPSTSGWHRAICEPGLSPPAPVNSAATTRLVLLQVVVPRNASFQVLNVVQRTIFAQARQHVSPDSFGSL